MTRRKSYRAVFNTITFHVLLFLSTLFTATSQRCSSEDPPQVPKYHLMEKCHRSTLGPVAKANFTSLTSCQRFGIEKKALALNFSPPEAIKDMEKGATVEYTCEVLKCAEADGGVSLVNDTRYDYYSIYAKHLPHLNSTCVPAIGMSFVQTKRLNYTDAAAECRNMTGLLVDIIGESRSDAYAQVLSGAGIEMAYVGVSSNNGSEFVSVSGDTFDCSTYRAWAPGHPKRNRGRYGCVAITRAKMWLTVPCRAKLPSLCELTPSGPYGRRGIIFKSRERNDTIPATTPQSENV